jgi:hypothetical protein
MLIKVCCRKCGKYLYNTFDVFDQSCNTFLQTKCIPWDYPTPTDLHGPNNFSLCTSYEGDGYNNSLGAFNSAMEDSRNNNHCSDSCLPNCDETSYEYGIDTTELNTLELCEDPITRKVYKNTIFSSAIFNNIISDCFESLEQY